MSLTKPQRALLAEICEHPQTLVQSYAPAIKLVGLGYAAWRDGRYGGFTLVATDAGVEANRK